MLKLDNVAAFVAIAEAGSISAAARRVGLAKSVISERLSELERGCETRLVQRTTRRLSLTEDGSTFLVRARRLLQEAADAMAELAERRDTLSGPLRLAAPVSFGVLHLGPALFSFLTAHPRIDLTLDLDDRFVDAAADGYDAVIRHGPLADDRLVAKRLASSRRVLVAAPDYLKERGVPTCLSDLERCCGILYANREADWQFAGPDGWSVVRPRTSLRVNNGIIMRDAALAGLGLTLLPTFFVGKELREARLSQIDVGMEAAGADLFVAYPRDRRPSAKILALVEHLRTTFEDPPYWDMPSSPDQRTRRSVRAS